MSVLPELPLEVDEKPPEAEEEVGRVFPLKVVIQLAIAVVHQTGEVR